VRISSDTPIPRVNGDARALGEAFQHLIRNAIEALANQPRPELSLILQTQQDDTHQPTVVLVIKDNGPGIPADLLSKVFSPFYTTKARGLGLGLPIAQRTILDHNGQIAIHSNELGTCVTVRLPAIEERGAPP
jgi:signal transduction histidine kinase